MHVCQLGQLWMHASYVCMYAKIFAMHTYLHVYVYVYVYVYVCMCMYVYIK